MKAKIFELREDDTRSRDFFLKSLEICDWHVLSKKLLDRFRSATGPMFAVAGDWYDFDRLKHFDENPTGPDDHYVDGEYPTDHLGAFVDRFLRTSENAIVVCEYWGTERDEISNLWWPPPRGDEDWSGYRLPRVACYGDKDVYGIVTPEITDLDMISFAVDNRGHWQTNVCSTCDGMPDGDILDEEFLDELVRHAKHIFMPAFDGTGFLLWSPT